MKRAMRLDRMRLAAMEATLRLYRDPDRLPELLPTLRYFTRSRKSIRAVAERLAPALGAALGPAWGVQVADCASQIGSGALPLEVMPSAALACRHLAKRSGAALDQLAERLRRLPMPIIGRIADGTLLLDLRCLENEAEFLSSIAALEAA
jgi:L-seryl-tRNA(Ser) seleniumtransferase